MKYNITLNRDEIECLLVLLSSEFTDCRSHCDCIFEIDGEAIENFKETMEIGRLMERFLKLLEYADREEKQACSRK